MTIICPPKPEKNHSGSGKRIFCRIIIIGIIGALIMIPHTAGLPMVLFPLKPSPDTGPYQDDEFQELANETIYGLSNQTMPNGTALRELQTVQQRLSKMDISPEFYPKAEQINAYLYYTARAGKEYAEVMRFYTRPYSPVYRDQSLIRTAREYQDASSQIWAAISDLYPGVSPYRLIETESPFSVNEDPNFRWPYDPPSTVQSGGLW